MGPAPAPAAGGAATAWSVLVSAGMSLLAAMEPARVPAASEGEVYFFLRSIFFFTLFRTRFTTRTDALGSDLPEILPIIVSLIVVVSSMASVVRIAELSSNALEVLSFPEDEDHAAVVGWTSVVVSVSV